jgi:hypothetical protein
VRVRTLLLVSEVVVVALLTEREHVMPETVQDATPPFIAVGYTAQVVFPQAHAPERLDLRTVWQQSQGSWRHHPVFQGLPIREVIVGLRGEDSAV